MRTGKLVRIIAALFMLLSLVGVSTYAAAGYAPAAAQDPPPDVQAPEIRAGGYSYTYVESMAITGKAAERKEGFVPDVLSPSAVEGQPKRLDWTPVRRVAVRPSYSQHIYAAIDNGNGLWRTTNGGDYWEQMPFGVGSGRAIVWYNSAIAIATFGDYDGGLGQYVNGGIWRTGDGGNTWQDVGAGVDYTVVAVAFDPTNPNRIYAATYQGGIYRGDYSAGSVSWTQINTGLSDTYIYSIAVAPSSPTVLYAGGMNWVYRSANSGDNWVIADNNYPSVYTEGLAVDPNEPNKFYAGAQRLGWLLTTGLTPGGVYKSTTGTGDGSLVLKNVGMQETFVLDIARDPLNANILYAGTWGSGLFRSDDGGETWYEKNAGLELPYIYGIEAVIDGSSPSGVTLYVATFYSGSGIFTSGDRGETWTDPWGGSFPSMFDITTTSSPLNLAAATAYGVFYSYDGGVNWYISPDLTNFRNGIVLELARDPSNSSKLLAATYGGGIWTSTSAGRYWTETSTGIGGGAYVYDVGFSGTAANTAYAGSYGVYRSTDGGATWAPFGSLPHYVRDVDGHDGTTANLYAGTHDAGVFTSPSSSASWTAINTGLGDLRIRSVKAVGASQVFAGTNGRSAWKYTGSWAQKGPFIRAPGVMSLAIHPNNDLVIFAGTDQGVYKSSNGGDTWEPKNQGLGGYGDLVISGISIDPSSPNTIYLATWGYGIFQSTNGGDTWTRFGDPLKSSKIYLPLVHKNYVPPYEATILYEGFEGSFPGAWSIGDANSSDGLYYWAKRTCQRYSGSYGGWAAGAGSTYLSCGSDYRNNMDSVMISGPFSLVGATGAELSFKLSINAESDYDFLCRYASADGNNFNGICTTGYSGGWIDRTLDLSSYLGDSSVWIMLRFVSDSSVTYPDGAHVDNITVRKWVGDLPMPDGDAPVDGVREKPGTFTLP
jgi:photosystem II stability/assembly factor-like uncharacterized protein